MNFNVEQLVSKKTIRLMIAIVLLISGALFCISPAIGEKSAGIVIGIGVSLIAGSVYYLTGAFKKESAAKESAKTETAAADKTEEAPAETEKKPKTKKAKKNA